MKEIKDFDGKLDEEKMLEKVMAVELFKWIVFLVLGLVGLFLLGKWGKVI